MVLEAQLDLAEFPPLLQVRFQAQIHLLSFETPDRATDLAVELQMTVRLRAIFLLYLPGL